MATRLKTVEYYWPFYTSTISDATETTLTQITLYLPESSKSFKSVVVDVLVHCLDTTLVHNDRRQLSFQLGSAGYTVKNNATASQCTQQGENWCLAFDQDVTSYCNTNWSGTSMTADLKILFDNAGATNVGFNNVSAKITITYEYDDTSATHVKTVRIPLDAPAGEISSTTKPGTATATIPQLTGSGSPLLPEVSPTVRQVVTVVQGLSGSNLVTDKTFSQEVDSLGAATTGTYEHGSTTEMFVRFHAVQSFDTTTSHSWYLWNSVAGAGHLQAWMVVTYEFTVSGTTTLLNSLLVPLRSKFRLGGTTSSDYERLSGELWIEEPTTITTKYLAAYVSVSTNAQVAGVNLRLGTGSFVAYTDDFQVYSGGWVAMIRKDDAFTLARGRNTLTVDGYRTDTTDLAFGFSGYVMVVYTSGVPSGGPGAANHTILWNILAHGTGAAGGDYAVAATAPGIPETDYFLSSPVGVVAHEFTISSAAPFYYNIQAERLAGDGGIAWESLFYVTMYDDAEPGVRWWAGYTNDIFKRWPNDTDTTRLDLETSRRFWCSGYIYNWQTVWLLINYHSITFTKSITVGGYAGTGTGLTVELFNASKNMKVGEFTTTTGSCTAKWYDSVDTYYAVCREDSTHVGRSDNFSLA